jgi:lysophospholipid acyltransferase (LPLAT)-like uncharacterized protein
MAFALTQQLKYRVLYALVSAVVVPFVRWVRWGWLPRCQVAWHPEAKALVASGQPFMVALWHGHMFSMLLPLGLPDASALLISQSRDGEFITRVAEAVGYHHSIRGAHGRGGDKAALGMQRWLSQANHAVVVFADGPRGPKHQVKPGTVKLAARCGVPIIPLGGAASHLLFCMTQAWDDYMGPWPFSPVAAYCGAPLWVAPEVLTEPLALTTTCAQVNAAVHAAAQQAQALLGSPTRAMQAHASVP